MMEAMPSPGQNLAQNLGDIFAQENERRQDALNSEAYRESLGLKEDQTRQKMEQSAAMFAPELQKAQIEAQYADPKAQLDLASKGLGIEGQQLGNQGKVLGNQKDMITLEGMHRDERQAQFVSQLTNEANRLVQEGADPRQLYGELSQYIGRDVMAEKMPIFADIIREQERGEKAQQKGLDERAKETGKVQGAMDSINALESTVSNPNADPLTQRAAQTKLNEVSTEIVLPSADPNSPNGMKLGTRRVPNEFAHKPKNVQDTMRWLHNTKVGEKGGLLSSEGSIWSFLPGVSSAKGAPTTKEDYKNLSDSQKDMLQTVHSFAEAVGDVPSAVLAIQEMIDGKEGKVDSAELARIIKNQTAAMHTAKSTPYLNAF